MEWLIVILVIAAFAAYLIYRYRKQIRTAIMMYRAFRQMRQQMKPTKKQVEPKARTRDTELVRCAKCGTWIPKDEAVKLKSQLFCSLACLEESVTVRR